jgi:hypothetical protein
MKSMSDEIVNLETVKAVETSLRGEIQSQAAMTISRVAGVRKLAIGLAVMNAILAFVFSMIIAFHM